MPKLPTPSLTTFVPAPARSAMIRRLVDVVARFRLGLVHRREINNLLLLDDRMLRDIGLVRSDALGAAAERRIFASASGLRLRGDERSSLREARDARVKAAAGRLTRNPAGRPAVAPVLRAAA